jgi:hypothetical protein
MTKEEQAEFDEMKKSVKKLTDNNASLKDEAAKARDAKRAAEEKADAADEEKRKAEEAKARENKDVEALERQYQAKVDAAEAKLATAEEKASAADKRYADSISDSGLKTKLTEAGVKPELLNGAAALLRSTKKVEVGDDGSISVDGEKLGDFVQGWSKSTEGAGFVANGNAGGGASGGERDKGGADKGGDKTVKPDLGGSKDERVAAIKANFPDLES